MNNAVSIFSQPMRRLEFLWLHETGGRDAVDHDSDRWFGSPLAGGVPVVPEGDLKIRKHAYKKSLSKVSSAVPDVSHPKGPDHKVRI